MARDAGGVPVVPLAVRGLYAVNRRGTWRFRPGHIQVYVGRQYETAGRSDAELRALAEEIHDVIAAWVERGELPEGALA